MQPQALAEMISLIEGGTISGKIGKEILPGLLQGEGERGSSAGTLVWWCSADCCAASPSGWLAANAPPNEYPGTLCGAQATVA